jgi:phosphoglycerate kinase
VKNLSSWETNNSTTKNSIIHPSTGKKYLPSLARGCDLYINDAFGTAHRAHASTAGVAGLLPHAAGLLIEREVHVLSDILKNPEHPLTLVVGGAKMKTKIGVIETFLEIADTILVGGGIANTFCPPKEKRLVIRSLKPPR